MFQNVSNYENRCCRVPVLEPRGKKAVGQVLNEANAIGDDGMPQHSNISKILSSKPPWCCLMTNLLITLGVVSNEQTVHFLLVGLLQIIPFTDLLNCFSKSCISTFPCHNP